MEFRFRPRLKSGEVKVTTGPLPSHDPWGPCESTGVPESVHLRMYDRSIHCLPSSTAGDRTGDETERITIFQIRLTEPVFTPTN